MSREFKVGVADTFTHGLFVVGDADVLGWVVWGGVGEVDGGGSIDRVTEKERDAFFVGPYISVWNQRQEERGEL